LAFHPVMPLSRNSLTSRRSASDRAPSEAACSRPQAASLDDVGWRQVPPRSTDPVASSMIADLGHGYLDDVRSESRDTVPPSGGQSARRCLCATSPNRNAYSRRVGERSIVGEEDTWRAAQPSSRADSSADGIVAESGSARLRERDYAVVVAEIVLEHVE
jgi:hypothetical protein